MDSVSEIHCRRHSSCAVRLHLHGERQSLVVESSPSSVRQIQQCLGSRILWVVVVRFGGAGFAASEDCARSTDGFSDGMEDASAGVGSDAKLGSLCSDEAGGGVAEVWDGSTNRYDSKRCCWLAEAVSPATESVPS